MTDSPIVTLRGQRNDDWDNLYNLLKRPDIVRFTDELPYISDDSFRDRYMTASSGLHRLVGEIMLPSGRNRFVGAVWLQVASARRRHSAQLEFVMLRDYYGTDVEASFLSQVIEFAGRWLGLRRVQMLAHLDDKHLMTLLEQYGFECEATQKRYIFRDGAFRDVCIMARIFGHERAVSAEKVSLQPEDEQASPRDHTDDAADEITVRGIESSDWEDAAEIVSCESAYANTLQLPYLSRDSVRERYENPADDVHMLAAEIDETVIGVLGVHLDPERRPHVASLGMMVHEEYHGRGVGTALMNAAVELCEQWLNVSRISLEVYPDNVAGIALYRKFGFEVEGTLRDYAYRAGQYVDAYLMARIREDEA